MVPRLIFLAPFTLFVLGSAAARADERGVFVHIRSPEVVRLEHRAAPASAWENACDSPCDRELPHDGDYRIVFTPTSAGEPFELSSDRGGEEELAMEMPSKGKKVAGQIVTGAGVLLAIGGVVGAASLGYIAAQRENCTNPDTQGCGLGRGFAALFAVFSGGIALGGGGLILGGLSLSSSGNGQTTQHINPKLDAFVREPTWAGVSRTSRAAVVVPWSLPF